MQTRLCWLAHCPPIFAQKVGLAASDKSQRGSNPDRWSEFYNTWHLIIQSPTPDVYYDRLACFEQKYLPLHKEGVMYIKKTWLLPHKEELVKAWVDQTNHFGNAVTSRVEGIHFFAQVVSVTGP